MAYDQASSYQPPRRAYYGQEQQQAPVQQQAYSNQLPQEQYGYDPGYDQGGYGSQYEQPQQQNGRSNGYEQPQQQGYSDGYYGGYQRPQEPRSQGGDRAQQPRQQQQERNYDPRYQQRPGRGAPQGYGQQSGQRVPPPQQQQQPTMRLQAPTQQFQQQMRHDQLQQQPMQQDRQGYQVQAHPHQAQARPDPRNGYPPASGDARADPRNGYPPANSDQRSHTNGQPQATPQKPRERVDQQSTDLVSPPRTQGNGTTPKPAAPPQKPEPKKMTMEEWKAKEKAKLHEAAQSLEYMPQDNAFPTFPNISAKKALKPDDRGASAMSQRTSAEEPRSSTSSRPGQHEQRPGLPRDNSFNREVVPPQQQNGNMAAQVRPSMGHKPVEHAQKPGLPRDNSFNGEVVPPQQNGGLAPQGRPSVDHKPFSFEPARQQGGGRMSPAPQPQQQQQQRPSYDRQASGQRQPAHQVSSPVNERQPQVQWPVHNGQTPPREDHRSPTPQMNGHRQPPQQQQVSSPLGERQPHVQWPVQNGQAPPREEYRTPPPPQTNSQSRPPMQAPQDSYQSQLSHQSQAPFQQRHPPPPAQARQQGVRPGTASGNRPPMQPIDTAVQQRGPAYMDHQPLSPAHIPPRPSTAQGARSSPAAAQQLASPLSQYSYSQTPRGYDDGGGAGAGAAQQPWAQQQPHTKQESLGELYDGYNDPACAPASAAAPPRHRDDEIEAEMPDFDSAAPAQTSLAHKRNQTVDRHLAADAPAAAITPPPPMPMPMQGMPVELEAQSAQGLSNPKTRFYQQQQPPEPYRDTATTEKQRHAGGPAAGAGRAANGFDFGGGVPEQQQHHAYNDPHLQQPQQRRGAPPVQPPQPPFAHEPPPRRSMDDARGMAHRPGPQGGLPLQQQQRFHPNGQPLRGPPFQQRPEMDRTFTGQSAQTAPLPYQQQRPDMDRNYSSQTEPFRGPGQQQRPDMDRDFSGQTMQSLRSDPGQQQQQRVGSAPPIRQGLQEPPGRLPSNGVGVPLTQQRSAPEQQQQRHSNPDALPYHPTPVRPGLMETGAPQPAKPPPIRNYSISSSGASSGHARQVSLVQPVTHAELDTLRAAVTANPGNNKQALLLVKKFVEASTVLAPAADPKVTARNREKFIFEAYKRAKKLVAAGYPEAQFFLADAYGQGSLGLEVDTKEAFNLYQAAAKQGHPQAAYRTAVCCEMGPEEGGGTRRDAAKAVQWYRRAAALGDVAAMYKLGIILLKSLLAQPRNVTEAVMWLKRAAERADKANPHALHELGTLYESGNADPDVRSKLPADDNYARELFQQAAGLGYKFAQFRFGQAYEYGALGLPIDNRASISWYSKAAAQGEHQAELALSGWYLTGAEGILEHSDTEAYLWARKAAGSEPPLAKAMFAMGYFSEMGIGCPVSGEEAKRWYGRAASYKFPKALERLEELRRNGKARPAPANGKLTRNQKKDEQDCVVM